MKNTRRKLLKASLIAAGASPLLWLASKFSNEFENETLSEDALSDTAQLEVDEKTLAEQEKNVKDLLHTEPKKVIEEPKTIITQVEKVKSPNLNYPDDVQLPKSEMAILNSTVSRLARIQKEIGFGNFNLVSFDQALKISQRSSRVGMFSKAELDFIEKIFSFDAKEYGFLGEKVTAQLTHQISRSKATKIPYTGHYLFKGESEAFYKKIRQDVGKSLILTSGVRSQVKQLYLFLAKAKRVRGNLSRASRSLAPPGYSFHGSGDFDVGKIGLGAQNFTEKFAETDEFKKLTDLGYISIRYYSGNKLGVRYEPWHVQLS